MITGKTAVMGLIGNPISHSFSPALHNAAFAKAGINAVYVPFPIAPDALEAGIRGFQASGVAGVNVTIPHKRAVMPLLDTVDQAAIVIGAVNTIVFDDTGAHGSNTDWSGFVTDITQHGLSLAGRDCLVLGAGGSARAIVYGLLQGGANVHLLARRQVQADEMKADFGRHIPVTHFHTHQLSDLATIETVKPLIINTTPLGMWPNVDVSAWHKDIPFPEGAFVYDLIYNPATTQLMKQGKVAGCMAANGLGMLLHQGAQAFEKWTGIAPDLAAMGAALYESQNTTLDA